MIIQKFFKTLFITTAFILVTTPALADAKDDKITAMEAQMRVMMQEIQNMKAERAAEKEEQQALREKVKALEAKTDQAVANIAPAAGGNDSGVNISMKGGTPKITKDEFSWQSTGRIHLDAGTIHDDKFDHPNSTEFRRARIGMQGKVSKDFGYKLEVDLANNGTSLTDTYINYSGIENADIKVGHFKPGYSLDEITSSNDITFIERASAVDSFTSARKIGLGVSTHGENWTANVGGYGGGAGTQSSDDEEWSIAGRVTGKQAVNDNTFIHVGGSAAYREPDQANDSFDFDSRAENRLQTSDSVSIVITDAEDAQIYGVEGAVVSGPFSAQGEYLIADVQNRGGQNPTYDGGHAQIAWTVTGEQRPYSNKKGAFGGIKPKNPLDPKNGHWGAVELAARFSHLNLNESGLNGGEMNNVTLGANWYLNDYVRLMANVIMVDTDNSATTPNDDPTVFVTRSQIKF